MKTPITEPISYNGWTIRLYLENFGFSFTAFPPACLPFDPLEDDRIYATPAEAEAAAHQLVSVDMVTLSLEIWLAEVHHEGHISFEEHEALCNSLIEVLWVRDGK